MGRVSPVACCFRRCQQSIVQPTPGYVLYNISDGVMATDLAGWLSRWSIAQKLNWNTTTLIWGVRQNTRSVWQTRIATLVIGFFVNSGLIVLSILAGDWFGFANAVAMVVSVLCRCISCNKTEIFLIRKQTIFKGTTRNLLRPYV